MIEDKPLVLVVDDDPTNLRILVSKLNQEYRLGVAKNGTRALEYMEKIIPDLVLLDVMMPDMDGYTVCQRMKQDVRLLTIPVVFISYVDDPGQKTRGFEVGGVDYITKPFHDAEVLARVRTHIMNKQMREQLERHNARIGRELEEQRRQLVALLDNLPGLAYRESVVNGKPHPRRAVTFVSDGVLGLTGYAPERFMGEEHLGLLDIAHEDDRETIRKTTDTALRERRRWELVYRIITAWGEEKWVWEQSSGAFDAQGRLITVEGLVNDITEKQKNELGIRKENEELKERLKARCFNNIVGDSAPMREVFELIARAGATEDCVVIFGESGTGKELAARAVHECGGRCDKPFIAVNCGAVPENLFESEFFGYRKGAFTGALSDHKGCLDRADGGTLFLDELGELSLSAQTKLLRAIEGQGFTPVGGSELHNPNFRIIAATNRDLAERVASGQMREDFFYRIHVIPIHLPPLRQRREDIPLLVDYFLNAYPRVDDLPPIGSDIMQAFMQYDWPGNIRELHNTLYRYLTLGRVQIGSLQISAPTGLAQSCVVALPEGAPQKPRVLQEPLTSALDRFEREYLHEILRQNEWKRAETADILGIDRRTLFRKIKQYGLEDEEPKEKI
ncbi:MAG: sigma 54-interacting transcriptional regulator [Bilophila sp.]